MTAHLAPRCPICTAEKVQGCRCRRGDSKCANGHQWHRGDDGELHEGSTNHDGGACCDEPRVLPARTAKRDGAGVIQGDPGLPDQRQAPFTPPGDRRYPQRGHDEPGEGTGADGDGDSHGLSEMDWADAGELIQLAGLVVSSQIDPGQSDYTSFDAPRLAVAALRAALEVPTGQPDPGKIDYSRRDASRHERIVRQAARPIPLDEAKVLQVVYAVQMKLQDALSAEHLERDTPLTKQPYGATFNARWQVFCGRYTDTDTKGRAVSVPIFVGARDVTGAARDYFVSGSVDRRFTREDPEGEKVALRVNIDPKRTPAEYTKLNDQALAELRSVVIHEMTHLRDPDLSRRPAVPQGEGPPTDYREYVNRRDEQRAFMQQVVAEVKASVHGGTQLDRNGIDQALLMSSTWLRLETYLTPENKRRMLGAIYKALESGIADQAAQWAAEDAGEVTAMRKTAAFKKIGEMLEPIGFSDEERDRLAARFTAMSADEQQETMAILARHQELLLEFAAENGGLDAAGGPAVTALDECYGAMRVPTREEHAAAVDELRGDGYGELADVWQALGEKLYGYDGSKEASVKTAADDIDLEQPEGLGTREEDGQIVTDAASEGDVLDRYEVGGLTICVENPAGSVRQWGDPQGEHGETEMLFDYGYIDGFVGADKDQVDCYVGAYHDAQWVYVVHQTKKPDFKEWDEDKVMLSFNSANEAREAYLAHYDDPRFFGGMSAFGLEDFKQVLQWSRENPRALTHSLAVPVDITEASMRHTATGGDSDYDGHDAARDADYELQDGLAEQSGQVSITGEDGEEVMSTLADFLEENADDPETCAAVEALEPGEEVQVGGGAAPLVTVRRTAACYSAGMPSKTALDAETEARIAGGNFRTHAGPETGAVTADPIPVQKGWRAVKAAMVADIRAASLEERDPETGLSVAVAARLEQAFKLFVARRSEEALDWLCTERQGDMHDRVPPGGQGGVHRLRTAMKHQDLLASLKDRYWNEFMLAVHTANNNPQRNVEEVPESLLHEIKYDLERYEEKRPLTVGEEGAAGLVDEEFERREMEPLALEKEAGSDHQFDYGGEGPDDQAYFDEHYTPEEQAAFGTGGENPPSQPFVNGPYDDEADGAGLLEDADWFGGEGDHYEPQEDVGAPMRVTGAQGFDLLGLGAAVEASLSMGAESQSRDHADSRGHEKTASALPLSYQLAALGGHTGVLEKDAEYTGDLPVDLFDATEYSQGSRTLAGITVERLAESRPRMQSRPFKLIDAAVKPLREVLRKLKGYSVESKQLSQVREDELASNGLLVTGALVWDIKLSDHYRRRKAGIRLVQPVVAGEPLAAAHLITASGEEVPFDQVRLDKHLGIRRDDRALSRRPAHVLRSYIPE